MAEVIIIEGPDGAGKTTAAEWLCQERGFTYRHEGPPPDVDRMEYYGRRLYRGLVGRRPIVYDRFHLGELVYGPIKRHVDPLTYYGLKLFQRVFKSQMAMCTIAMPSYAMAVANWEKKLKDGNDYLQHSGLFFDSYYRFKGLTAYHDSFDYVSGNFGEHYAGWREQQQQYLTGDVGVIGDPLAQVLVVGEQVNGTETDFPFFNSYNSSRFLNEALWEAGFKEDELLFTNAKRRDGKMRALLPLTVWMRNFRVVIACGEIAQKECEKHDIPYAPLTHPACFFRFHQTRRAEFVASLQDIRRTYVGN